MKFINSIAKHFWAIFDEKIEIREWCKGVHCVDLGESFPTSIYMQNLASIQLRKSLVKFARSPRTDPPGSRGGRPRSAGRDKLCGEAGAAEEV